MKFRFLSNHTISDRHYAAGEIAEMPADWKPCAVCEPLDGQAVASFHAAGPQPLNVALGVAPPVTYWELYMPVMVSAPYKSWRLTGLGQHYQAMGEEWVRPW